MARSSWHTETTITSTILCGKERGGGGWVEPGNRELKTQEIHWYLAFSRKQDETSKFCGTLKKQDRRWYPITSWGKLNTGSLRRMKSLMMHRNSIILFKCVSSRSQASYMHCLIYSSCQTSELGFIKSILDKGQRLRGVKWNAEGHLTSQWQSWYLLTSKLQFCSLLHALYPHLYIFIKDFI